MSIKFKNVVNPNMEMLVNLIVEKFGDWIEKISAYPNGLYVILSDNDKCNSVYMIKDRLDIDKVYNDFSSLVIKAEKHFQDTNILNAYLKNFSEDINIANIRDIIEFSNKQGIKLIYQYDLLGILDGFRLTEKSIIGYDSMDNKVIFNNHSNKNYTFCKSGLMVSKL